MQTNVFLVGGAEYGKMSKSEVQLHVVLYEGDWRRRHREATPLIYLQFL